MNKQNKSNMHLRKRCQLCTDIRRMKETDRVTLDIRKDTRASLNTCPDDYQLIISKLVCDECGKDDFNVIGNQTSLFNGMARITRMGVERICK